MSRDDRRDRVTIEEIAELTKRLRGLSIAGAGTDEAERAAFLADKDALLARIAAEDADVAARMAENRLHAAAESDEQERAGRLTRRHADDARDDAADDSAEWSR